VTESQLAQQRKLEILRELRDLANSTDWSLDGLSVSLTARRSSLVTELETLKTLYPSDDTVFVLSGRILPG
jgi:hypothetical protein